jgi:antirestriction protein ArdC
MKDVYQSITDHILNTVDDAGEWRPCWHGMNNGRPTNAISGHHYQGVNILTCWVAQMVHSYPTQQWATYKQWQAAGAQVNKGERGTPIIFYKQLSSEDPDDDGRILVRASHIFNAAQVQG